MMANTGRGQIRERGSHYIVALSCMLTVAMVMAFTIARLRWTYVVGISFAFLIVYVLVVLNKVEIALVGYFASALVVEHVFRGGIQAGGFEIGYREFVLVALLVVYLLGRERDREPVPSRWASARQPRLAGVLFACYVFCFLVATTLNEDIVVGARWWVSFALEAYLVFWLTWEILSRPQRMRIFVHAIMTLMTLVSLNENLKMVLGVTYLPYRYPDLNVQVTYAQFGLTSVRLLPVLAQAPFAGALMVSFFPLALLLIFHEHGLWRRLFYLCASLSLGFNIVFYLDRGSWLACVGSMVVLAVLTQRKKSSWAVSAVAFGCVVWGLVAMGPHVEGLRWVFSGRADSATLFQSVRFTIWGKVLEALPHLPVFGVGWGETPWNSLVARYSPLSYPNIYGFGPFFWTQPHNSYLQLLLSTGFPTFVCFAALIVLTMWVALKSLGAEEPPPRREVLLGMFAGLVGLLTQSALDRTLWLVPMNVLLWMLVGAVWALSCPVGGLGRGTELGDSPSSSELVTRSAITHGGRPDARGRPVST